MITPFITALNNADANNFKTLYQQLQYNELEIQSLLVAIVEHFYTIHHHNFFIDVFDCILSKKCNLNFNIDNWAPTFLCLVADKGDVNLLQYFTKKGADINFIGDRNAFEDEDYIDDEDGVRYYTCLDFVEIKWQDMLYENFEFKQPYFEKAFLKTIKNKLSDTVEVSKAKILNLVEQTNYLHELINTERILQHLKANGGKCFTELSK